MLKAVKRLGVPDLFLTSREALHCQSGSCVCSSEDELSGDPDPHSWLAVLAAVLCTLGLPGKCSKSECNLMVLALGTQCLAMLKCCICRFGEDLGIEGKTGPVPHETLLPFHG